MTQGLVTAKSRLAKQGLTIPRLELVSSHMAINLAVNIRKALEGFPLTTNIQCWLDSTVALYWLSDSGEYCQLWQIACEKYRAIRIYLWRHKPTAENLADLGSRGGSVTKAELWWRGPKWLSNPNKWPSDNETNYPRELSRKEDSTSIFRGCCGG